MANLSRVTKAQKKAAEKKALQTAIITALRREKGGLDLNRDEMAAMLGISANTWQMWTRKQGLETATFGKLLDALYACGLTLQLTPLAEAAK